MLGQDNPSHHSLCQVLIQQFTFPVLPLRHQSINRKLIRDIEENNTLTVEIGKEQIRVFSRLSTVQTITDISLWQDNAAHGTAWESHRGPVPLTHCWPGSCFQGGPPFYCYSVSEKSHNGSCWQRQAPFNGEISLSPHPPVPDEPVSDLDSGCIQPSFVGNPLSYPLHLAFLTLCFHFAFQAEELPPLLLPLSCPFSFLTITCHVAGICLRMQRRGPFAWLPLVHAVALSSGFCKHKYMSIVSHGVKC